MSHTIFPTDSAASVIFPATIKRCHIDPKAFLLLPFHFLMSNKLEDKPERWLRGASYDLSLGATPALWEMTERNFTLAFISLPVHKFGGQSGTFGDSNMDGSVQHATALTWMPGGGVLHFKHLRCSSWCSSVGGGIKSIPPGLPFRVFCPTSWTAVLQKKQLNGDPRELGLDSP